MNQILNTDQKNLHAAAKLNRDRLDHFIMENKIKVIKDVPSKWIRERMSSKKPQILLHREALLTKLSFQIARIRKRKKQS